MHSKIFSHSTLLVYHNDKLYIVTLRKTKFSNEELNHINKANLECEVVYMKDYFRKYGINDKIIINDLKSFKWENEYVSIFFKNVFTTWHFFGEDIRENLNNICNNFNNLISFYETNNDKFNVIPFLNGYDKLKFNIIKNKINESRLKILLTKYDGDLERIKEIKRNKEKEIENTINELLGIRRLFNQWQTSGKRTFNGIELIIPNLRYVENNTLAFNILGSLTNGRNSVINCVAFMMSFEEDFDKFKMKLEKEILGKI
jgi:hypothetical protein